jgi:hypothetical protein
MSRNTYGLVAAAMAIGLVASACNSSPNSATTTTSQATATQLQSLIPTSANTQRTDGPTSIPDNGIHMHFLVNTADVSACAWPSKPSNPNCGGGNRQ